VRAEHEAERDQTDVMALAGSTGEDRQRASAAAPQAGEGEQSLTDEVAGEVLLPDLELSALPFPADLPQRREDQLPQDRLEREAGQRLVEHRVHCCFVVGVRGGDQALARVVEHPLRRACLRECTAGCLRGREALVERALHLRDALRVLARVEAEASFGADRLQQAVAALPRA
jgi:hypothetical protein